MNGWPGTGTEIIRCARAQDQYHGRVAMICTSPASKAVPVLIRALRRVLEDVHVRRFDQGNADRD
jgi:hypothetical protein